MRIEAIDHIQLAMPAGGEATARAFYAGLLGLAEVPKPAALHNRGGVWFSGGSVRLHLGVETPFTLALKAHPALRVVGLEALVAVLAEAGVPAGASVQLDGTARVYVKRDPFGNRIELMEPLRG